MPRISIKLKRSPDASTIVEFFDALPSWHNLSWKIVNLFNIPLTNVGAAYIHNERESITLTNDQGLQQYFSGQSREEFKFVVQDIHQPDSATTIASTWSAATNLFDLANTSTDIKLFCLLLAPSNPIFAVDIDKNLTVDDLRVEIKKKMGASFPHYELGLWQINPPVPSADVGQPQSPEDIEGCIKLHPTSVLSAQFPSPLSLDVHVAVMHIPSRKRPRSPTAEESEGSKRIRAGLSERSWTVNGPIYGSMANRFFFLDPAEHSQTKAVLRAVEDGQFLLVTGARASGKSTRLFRLRELLNELGYYCLYFSFEFVTHSRNVDAFWLSIGGKLRLASGRELSISSPDTFQNAFAKENWDKPVVLLIDELSVLSETAPEIKDSFLYTLRELRHIKGQSAIESVVGVGTFSLMRINPTNPSLSPFNVSDTLQTPYFTIDDTHDLFRMFQRDYNVAVESAVVDDIWAKANGHPGMVCLCGKVVANNLSSLLKDDGSTVSFSNWQSYPIENLYNEIAEYNTFSRMIGSLRDQKAREAVQLYRCRFAGFLEDVKINYDDRDLADFLTSEGVLVRPVPADLKHRVASPLIDALIRLRVIPKLFPSAPSVAAPRGVVDVPFIIKECLKCFDKGLIRSAYNRSFKLSTVSVDGSTGAQVPRESVYDTELMRILCNWLTTSGWSVTGQWQTRTADGGHKFSNVVLQDGRNKRIVFELVATADSKSIKAHIDKMPEYMERLSTTEGWVIHFTCEDRFSPTWQSAAKLRDGVNVIHVAHKEDFTNVTLHVYSKDVKKKKFSLCI